MRIAASLVGEADILPELRQAESVRFRIDPLALGNPRAAVAAGAGESGPGQKLTGSRDLSGAVGIPRRWRPDLAECSHY